MNPSRTPNIDAAKDDFIVIDGIDLAWGNRSPDGLCRLEADRHGGTIHALSLNHGDDKLHEFIQSTDIERTRLLAIDAPLICRNRSGARPVDAETHRVFGRFKCGCYPVNQELGRRPIQIARSLSEAGFQCDWQLPKRNEPRMIEVYPHTALVRWFNLTERIPYKKGRVSERRQAFAYLQELVHRQLAKENIDLPTEFAAPLEEPWTKNREDQIDALICALIGYHHWKHEGVRSQILGDTNSGFLVTVAPDKE